MPKMTATAEKTGRYVSYLRVSTGKQAESGLGIEAQRDSVLTYLNGGKWELLGEYVEYESGANDARPELAKALATCRRRNAVLLVAKLDRLSRDVHFLTGLERSGVRFLIAEFPEATSFMIHILADVAQHERELISQRTRAALAAAKRRGVQLGGYRPGALPAKARKQAVVTSAQVRGAKADTFARDYAPRIAELREQGHVTLAALASVLNAEGDTAPRGGQWTPTQVQRLLRRIQHLPTAP